MSKFDECMDVYKAQVSEFSLGISDELLTSVAKGLGPSIYNADSSKVSASDPEEIARIKTNYLINKLGLSDDAAMDSAIDEIMDKLGSSNKSKYRAVVYAYLCKKFGKESIYA